MISFMYFLVYIHKIKSNGDEWRMMFPTEILSKNKLLSKWLVSVKNRLVPKSSLMSNANNRC